MPNLQQWLSQPPRYTTFRVNKLEEFDCDTLNNFLKTKAKELNTSALPNVYFLKPDCLVLEQWPETVQVKKGNIEVIVDALCAAAVLRGAHVFAPGVMGMPINCQLGEKVDIYGDMEGQCKRGLKITFEGKKLFVGTGVLKMLRHDLFDNGVQPRCDSSCKLLNFLWINSINIIFHVYLLFQWDSYRDIPVSRLPVVNETICPPGVLLLQNLPSIVCGWVLNALPHEHILDMCAAPGNKTTHLGEMSNNQAKIIALDKTPQKVERIKENCVKQGVYCVNAYAFDSTKCCSLDSNNVDSGPPFPPNSFDKVLLDAPCSGLGQRPQLNNKMTPKMLESYKFVQRKLMKAAVDVLKVGGKLVYSTCTVTVDENEGMVQWALEKFPCLQLIPAEPLLGGPGLHGSGLNDEQRVMVQRFSPEIDPLRLVEPIYRDCIGFFIATFTKTC